MKKSIRNVFVGTIMSMLLSTAAFAGTATTGAAGGCTFNGKITYSENYNGWSSARTYASYGTAYVFVTNETTFVKKGGKSAQTLKRSESSTVTRDVTVYFSAPNAEYYPLVIKGTHTAVANGANWSDNTSYYGTVR